MIHQSTFDATSACDHTWTIFIRADDEATLPLVIPAYDPTSHRHRISPTIALPARGIRHTLLHPKDREIKYSSLCRSLIW